MDSRKAERRKLNVLRFDLESGGEEQGAENNEKEMEMEKKIRKKKSKC